MDTKKRMLFPDLLSIEISADPYRIVPMTLSHALDMKKWGRHASNLYREYNYSDLSETELRRWHERRQTHDHQYFAIEDESGRCVGFIGLKEIRKIRRSAVLGFAVDQSKIGRGVGSKAFASFLPAYFGVLGFRTMDLFMYTYNERAYRIYKKLGFTLVDRTVDEIKNPDNFPSPDELAQYPDSFIKTKHGYYFEVYRMRLTRAAFLAGGGHEI